MRRFVQRPQSCFTCELCCGAQEYKNTRRILIKSGCKDHKDDSVVSLYLQLRVWTAPQVDRRVSNCKVKELQGGSPAARVKLICEIVARRRGK